MKKTEANFISVIIPSYHDWSRLQLCLDALDKQSYPQELYEIIAVNNDPADKAPNSFILPGNCTLLEEGRPGSYAARNAALAIAKGEIIAFTDSDCIPDEKWLTHAAERLQHGAERIAGRVELFFKSDKLTLAEIYEKAFAFDQELNAKRGGSVTANMITWRKHFDAVGWFNDSLMSGGDNEWGWRAKDLGIPIQYAPDVVVKHPARNSIRAILQKKRRVAGGAVNIDREETSQSVFMLLIRGFLPPARMLIKLWRKKNMILPEKLLAACMAYYFKIYKTTYVLVLRLGLKEIERI
jgi:cellulose synthase/poly-beta-1,6-N-acetylglucosamine synthase-like glycosyltransferase